MKDSMNDNIFQVSIIIPTCDRKDSLREALLSLSFLDYPENKYEVIVVDDGSTDGTGDMIIKIRDSLSYSLSYGRLNDKTGISAARNLGMEMAKGHIFVFTDDDCLFEKRWLTRLLDPFVSNRVGAVGGLDKAPQDATLFSKCIGHLFTSFIGTGGLRGGDMLRVGRYYPKGCNMAVLREAIDKVGGFDEQLGPGEEIELGYRIGRAGYKIIFAPGAFVWHKRKVNLKAFLKKIYTIGYTRVILARKHKGLRQIGHMIPFIGILTVFSLFILSFVFPYAFKALISILSLYLLILLFSGVQALFRIRDVRVLFLIPLIIILHHSTHGIGFLMAVIKYLLGFEKKR